MKLNIALPNLVWQLVVTLASSFIAIFIPIDIVYNLRTNDTYVLLNGIATFILFLDIFYNIYRFKNEQQDIFLEDMNGLNLYFRKWFIFDLLGALPVSFIVHPSLFQLLRLLKLVKVAYFMRQLRQREVQFAGSLSLIFFAFWIFHFAHWVACGWLAIRGFDLGISTFENYMKSLYWTVTTITTVGYGDITPQNSLQIAYTIFVEILGVGTYGYLIGKIASFLSKRDPAKSRYLTNMENLTALVKLRRLPLELQKRIRNYYTYMYKQRMGYDEGKFLEGLPDSLKNEVAIHLKKEVIEKIDLFKNQDDSFLREVAYHLKPLVVTPGDYVFHEGQEGHNMYFVVSGELEVLVGKNEEFVSELKAGDFFGEIALFENKPRTATIKATTYCDLYTLSKSRFEYVVAKYPHIKNKIELKADARRRN